MFIDLNNKKFKSEFNSKNGEVSDQTIFSYNQKDKIIWAEYSGGEILKGSIIGKIIENHLEFVYQHINKENELMTGNCKSYAEQTKDGKIRLKETWQWTCKDNSLGESTLIEIQDGRSNYILSPEQGILYISNSTTIKRDPEKRKYKISDLYEMEFQTEMTEQEYMREGLLNLDLPISPDVQKEQEKIESADCIIFLYPVWWSDCPAKLKGWFDRVYTVGYAYGYDNKGNKIKKMKTVKYGISLCTAGHPNKFLDEIGIAESMRNVMIDDRLGQRFNKKEMIILGGTLEQEKVEKEHSEIIKNIGEQIKKYCA